MAQKKPKKKAAGRRAVIMRFNADELAALEADRIEVEGTGVPVSLGAYSKHAVQSYRRLRKIEENLRMVGFHSGVRAVDPEPTFARMILDGAP